MSCSLRLDLGLAPGTYLFPRLQLTPSAISGRSPAKRKGPEVFGHATIGILNGRERSRGV